MSILPIDCQPSVALPSPMGIGRCFLGQCVVHPNDSTHNEEAVSDFVRNAEGVFAKLGIDVEWPAFKSSVSFSSRPSSSLIVVQLPNRMTCGFDVADTIPASPISSRAAVAACVRYAMFPRYKEESHNGKVS